jgi:uncharacterized protein YfiM (DUF2279 family)
MKTNWSLCLQWLFAAFLMAAFTSLNAQTFSTSVNSSNGYTVHVELTPVAVNATTPCQWGFNYTVDIAYNIWFTGNNVPNSLWVLQAEIKCEDDFFFDLPNIGGSGVLTTGQQWRNQSNCATASPISMECFEIELEIQGPSLSRRFIDQDLEYTQVVQAMLNGGSFCPADFTQLPYETYGNDDFNSGNIFTAQLSDANGSFANPINIGTRSDRDGGTIQLFVPTNLPSGTGYRVRVISSNPATVGPDNGTDITIQSPDLPPTAWGDGEWLAHCFNIPTYLSSPNDFNYTNYRGYYTSTGININSTSQWPQFSTPSNAAGYVGCAVSNDRHIVRYRRQGFTCGTYRLHVRGTNNAAGYSGGARVTVNGVVVWQATNCCTTANNVWTGELNGESQVEFVWSDNTGDSYGRLTFEQLNSDAAEAEMTPNITVCAGSSAQIGLEAGSGSNYNWNANTTYLSGATNGPTVVVAPPAGTPNGTQTYTLTYLDETSGCERTGSVTVNIASSSNTTITADQSGCTAGGIEATVSGASSYTWSPSQGVVLNNSNGSAVTLAPLVETTYTVTGTIGCHTSLATITVGPTIGTSGPESFGDEIWHAHCYNIATYTSDPSQFNLTDYRGMYTEEELNFNSSNRWDISSNPATASGYIGCSVNNERHIVSYRRKGFPCGTYRLHLRGLNNEAGHDDAVRLVINGETVFSNTGCCDVRNNVWMGALDSDTEIELTWSENGGLSYGRMFFEPIHVNEPTLTAETSVVAGESITLTANLNGALSYDWSTNDQWLEAPLNTSSVTLSPPANAPSGTYTYTVRIQDPISACDHVLNTDVEIGLAAHEWNGTTNDQWSTANNWLNGTVPPSGADVTITGAGSPPIISGNIQVGDITLQDGASLSFANGFATLRVSGDFVNNAEFAPGEGKVAFNGASIQTISGSNVPVFHGLRMDGGDTLRLETPIHLTGALQPAAGVFDWNNHRVTLLSDANNTGSIGEIKNGAEILGDSIIYQRFVPTGSGSWRMLCTPLTDVTFEQWNDDFPTTGFPGADFPNWPNSANPWPSIRIYDESVIGTTNQGFEGIDNITAPIENGVGYFTYFIPNSTLIDAEGSFHQGPKLWNLSHTNSGTDARHDGWNLIGNPYPSAIDWNSQTGWAKSNVANAVYAFSSVTGQYTAYINGVGIGEFNGQIASAQAFWVKAESSGASVAINESAKIDVNGVFLRSSNANTESLVRIRLNTPQENIWDETVVGFHSGADEGFDAHLDAWKFFASNEQLPNIATRPLNDDSRALAISMLPLPEEDTVVDLVIRSGSQTQFTLVNTLVDSYESEICLVLEDRELENRVSFNQNESYSFSVGEMPLEERFALRFSAPIDLTVFDESCPNADDGKLIAQGFGEAPWTFTWIDEMGQIIRTTESSTVADVFENLTPGFYEVRVENSGEFCTSIEAVAQVHAAEPAEVEVESTTTSCNTANDGSIAFYSDGMYSYTFSGDNGDGLEFTIANLVGDTVLTDLPAGVYQLTALHQCGEEFSVPPVDLRDPNAVNAGIDAGSGATTLGNGGSIAFTNTSSGNATEFVWDFGDGSADSTSHSPVHSYASAGYYTVQLIARNSRCTDTTSVSITVSNAGPAVTFGGAAEATTGVEDETEAELAEAAIDVTIASERMLIINDEAIEERVTVSIFSLSGQRVLQQEFAILPQGQTDVNLSSLNQGMYTYGLQTDTSVLKSGEFVK